MPWSYNPLWKKLIDKGIKRSQLNSLASVQSHTVAKMGRNEPVTMDTLEKLCDYLDCRIEDIVEYVPKEKD